MNVKPRTTDTTISVVGLSFETKLRDLRSDEWAVSIRISTPGLTGNRRHIAFVTGKYDDKEGLTIPRQSIRRACPSWLNSEDWIAAVGVLVQSIEEGVRLMLKTAEEW